MSEADLNTRIRQYCEARGIEFKPWQEPRPWDIGLNDDCPYPPGSAGGAWWPVAKRLRRKIITEIRRESRS